MNKFQWAVIYLSGIAFLIYFFIGRFMPYDSPINVLVGAIILAAIVILVSLVLKQRTCSNCGQKLPRMRKPKNKRQAMYGGWTCPKCGSELDSSGNVIQEKKT